MSKAARRVASTSTLLLGAGVAPLCASAATIAVLSPNDTSLSGSLTCTLRQAIVTMNTGAAVGNCSASQGVIGDYNNDTIVFTAGAGSTIALTDAIAGGGALLVTDPALTIDGSAIAGGVTIMRAAAAPGYFGIFYDTAGPGSSLNLTALTISSGHSVLGCDIYGSALGGGICDLKAHLTLDNCTVEDNVAGLGGGIYAKSGNITLTNSTVSGNRASQGAGVFAKSGTVTATGSTISNNQTQDASTSTSAVGGGIYAGGTTLTLTGTTVSGNTASNGGGIKAPVAAVTLTRTVVDGNKSLDGDGGGIYSGTSLTVSYSTVSNNIAPTASGGGIRGNGTVVVSNSTISGNQADTGGGIEAYGSSLTLFNSTISGNIASRYAGAIFTGSAGITLNNSTLALNSTGVVLLRGTLTITPGFSGPHTVTFNNTLFWGNTYDVAANVSGGVTIHGNRNVVQSTAKTFSPVIFDNTPLDGDPKLGPLTANGGPTRTMALQAGSFALDAGDASLVPGALHDQRGSGYARVSGAAQDIGAYERQIDEIFYNGFN